MKDSPTRSRVLQLAHPPIPIVRIGIIGLGNRGLVTLQRYLQIEGTTVKALSEIREGNLHKAPTHTKRSKATRSHRIYRTGRLAKDVRMQ